VASGQRKVLPVVKDVGGVISVNKDYTVPSSQSIFTCAASIYNEPQ
jgi:hypothetical protein